jgi:competence protein ComEC
LPAQDEDFFDASDDDFLELVKPEFCIIMVGEGNAYGHPYPEAPSQLHDCGCTIYRTMKIGRMIVSTDGEDYQFIDN